MTKQEDVDLWLTALEAEVLFLHELPRGWKMRAVEVLNGLKENAAEDWAPAMWDRLKHCVAAANGRDTADNLELPAAL